MNQDQWSPADKKVARRAYDAALHREIASVMAHLKEKAAAAATPDDIWTIEQYLTHKRREIDSKYDYRYSRLVMVFGALMRDGWLSDEDLVGLSEQKLSAIHFLATV